MEIKLVLEIIFVKELFASSIGVLDQGFFLRFRFGDRKEILRDRLEEFERPFSVDVISGHYILRDRWRNLRDRFGPSKHLKKTLFLIFCNKNWTVTATYSRSNKLR